MRLVLDTNVLVSALMLPHKPLAVAVYEAIQRHTVLMSRPLWAELVDVVSRPKLRKYVDDVDRQLFLKQLLADCEDVLLTTVITACRDPQDNHLLALALDGNADCIVTGDNDLLVLHPWRKVNIILPSALPGLLR